MALSSDRYSSLPHLDNSDSGYVRDDLEMLIDQMWPLEDQLGNLQSYQDFAFPAGAHHRRRRWSRSIAGIRVQPVKDWEGPAGPSVQTDPAAPTQPAASFNYFKV